MHTLRHRPLISYNGFIKRTIDVFLSVILMFLLLPLFLSVSLMIAISSSGSILFPQKRIGKNGVHINILKFRSMTDIERNAEEYDEIFGDHPEVTSVGKWIRRFKIDELPQLISVFKGDMSLVGPRPCLPDMESEFDANGRKRLEVRPGCTGLAQVNGNINLSWPDRWKYDAYYVENLSFFLDLKIILKTIKIIFKGEHNYIVPFESFITKQCGASSAR